MSWNVYIDKLKEPDSNNIVCVEEASIWGLNPVSRWDTTTDCKDVTAEEVKILLGDRTSFQCAGPKIGGLKYMLLKDELDDEGSHSMRFKTKTGECPEGIHPICVAKGKQLVIIAKGPKDSNAGGLTSKVYGVLKPLRDSNY